MPSIPARPAPSGVGEISVLLRAWSDGDQTALERLTPIVYQELRRLASRYMRGERHNHSIETGALVNEAYLRLVDYQRMQWRDRAHFFAVSAQLMRRILVDHARAKKRVRRGGDKQIDRIDDWQIAAPQPEDDILALDDALNRLAALSPRQSRVVELRYFAGLTEEQVAELLGVTRRTVNRDWLMARTWLHRQLHPGSKNDA